MDQYAELDLALKDASIPVCLIATGSGAGQVRRTAIVDDVGIWRGSNSGSVPSEVLLRQCLDLQVFSLQPLLDQRPVAFDRAMQRLLAGDAQLRQQPSRDAALASAQQPPLQ